MEKVNDRIDAIVDGKQAEAMRLITEAQAPAGNYEPVRGPVGNIIPKAKPPKPPKKPKKDK